jgi:hypothetical protein
MLRAMILAQLGELDAALAALEQATEGRDSQMIFVKVEPRLERLRTHPRFQAVLRNNGLA